MREWQRQSHVKWYCRYHVVIVPKYRQKVIFGRLRKDIGRILRELCDQFGIELIEGHAMPDHVHMCLSIPPKYSVANAIGRLKGKSAIRIHRDYLGRRCNFTGFHFWAKGYCVSTVGLDEEIIRKYIRNQEEADQREDEQLKLDDQRKHNLRAIVVGLHGQRGSLRGHLRSKEPLEGLIGVRSSLRNLPGPSPFRGFFTQRPPLEGILKPPALRVVDDCL